MKYKHFLEMLAAQEFSAVNPFRWADQYELYWLKYLETEEGQNRVDAFLEQNREKITNPEWVKQSMTHLCSLNYSTEYAICFSKACDSELMWRANSDNGCAVMIRSTKKKIEDYGKSLAKGYHIKLSEIQYDLDNTSFESFLEMLSINPDSIGFSDYEEWFLHKRQCFEYEQEVRLLISPADIQKKKDIIRLPVEDISKIIDGVMVHPSAKDDHVATVSHLCDIFHLNFLGKSQIYTFSSSL